MYGANVKENTRKDAQEGLFGSNQRSPEKDGIKRENHRKRFD